MKLWILGSKGMLGSALMNLCAERGMSAVGTERSSCDITSAIELQTKIVEIAPTHVINCAAFTDVDGAEVKRVEAMQVNAFGAHNVAAIAKRSGVRLVHVSTDYVFDGKGARAYVETDRCDPISWYGKSKWEGEKALLLHYPEACVIRTSWLFGRGGKNFISALLQWLKVKSEIKVVDDQCGRPTYVKDLAEAVLRLLDQRGIYHFANAEPASRFAIAQSIWKVAKAQGIPLTCEAIHPVASSEFPTPAARPAFSVLDTGKYTQATGHVPRDWNLAFEEFLREMS